MPEEPRFYPLGPSAQKKKDPIPEKGKHPRIKSPTITPQEAFHLPSIEDSLKPSKENVYLLSLVEEISAKVDEISEKLEDLLHPLPKTAAELREGVRVFNNQPGEKTPEKEEKEND